MPEIVYNVKFRIKQEQIGSSGVADITAYEREIEKLRNTVDQQAKAVNVAAEANENYNASTKGFTQNQKNANKQLAIGNQLFFSLSDGIQDSAQFSQGFAQGMRAVGNNIGFTAELAGSFVNRVRELNGGLVTTKGVLDGLKASFLGVGGVIFLINTAITAITIFSAAQDKARRATAEVTESVIKYEEALARALKTAGAFGDDPFNVEQTSFLLEIVSRQIREANEAFFTEADQDRLNELRASYSALLQSTGSERAQQMMEEIQSEINVLLLKKEQSTTQEQINTLTQKQKELADDLGISLGIINDERFKAAQAPSIIKIPIEDIEESWAQISDIISEINEDNVDASEKLWKEDAAQFKKSQETLYSDIIILRNQYYRELRAIAEQDRRIQIQRDRESAQIQEDIERQKAQSIIAINQSLFTTIASISSVFQEKNKGLAIAFLAVEKGLRIAEVVVNAAREIGVVEMAAARAGVLALPNVPAAIAAASAVMSAVPLIKASAATSIASILATGIGQGAKITGGGRGAGGSARGSSSARQSSMATQTGFSTTERQAPTFTPSAQQQKPQVVLNATAKIDRRGLALLVRDGEGQLQSSSIITTSS